MVNGRSSGHACESDIARVVCDFVMRDAATQPSAAGAALPLAATDSGYGVG